MSGNYTSSGGPPISEAMYNGGTALGQNLSFGTADSYSVTLVTGGTAAMTVDTSQAVTFAGAVTFSGAVIYSGLLEIANGSAAAPSLCFANSTTTGWFRASANEMALSLSGVQALSWKSSQMFAVDTLAAAATPFYSFASDADTGMCRTGANTLVLATNGTAGVTVGSSQQVTLGGVLLTPSGAVGAPSVSVGEATTGFYLVGAGDLGVAVSGVKSLEIKGLDVVVGNAAIATSATSGFLWAPSCAGAATGTPANTFTGRTPLVFDSTNGRLYAYYGGAWKYAAVAT